jgi:hypothetical protein
MIQDAQTLQGTITLPRFGLRIFPAMAYTDCLNVCGFSKAFM